MHCLGLKKQKVNRKEKSEKTAVINQRLREGDEKEHLEDLQEKVVGMKNELEAVKAAGKFTDVDARKEIHTKNFKELKDAFEEATKSTKRLKRGTYRADKGINQYIKNLKARHESGIGGVEGKIKKIEAAEKLVYLKNDEVIQKFAG